MPHTGTAKWCNDFLPFSYFYVQNTHWDNGFLHYYQVKQIPNFLLAAPMVFLCVFASAMYIGKNTTYSVTLGLIDPNDAAHKKSDDEELGSSSRRGLGFDSKKCLVYVCHMLYMVMFGVLFMHVQVITRLIAASCPILYWFVASLTISQDQLRTRSGASSTQGLNGTFHSSSNKTNSWEDSVDWDSHWLNNVIFVYFHLYFFVGVAAFSNFLPWT
ncbi:hypothetical protein CAPTEDRAFT_226128 [Capitella teleta]|uniref:GPI mannosyltransferase 2 n=1 Tax=Capitella teleta TaxID=283909 RepID=R7TWM5_CAPTE|nr:hypothetical protein CAPTEDRAFT_226128 [Capitella teleta]|eukprot:ELT98164.1 hypothetical protein CAPTEDRAFT_226128 [Capitella teleta]